MPEAADRDSLQPALQKAQAELAKHLDEACEAEPQDVTEGSVDELLRLEEELLAAARAADEAVRLRRRLEERGSGAPDRTKEATWTPSVSPPAGEPGGRVREFRDRQGKSWRVWEVRPGLGRPLRDLHRYLGDYVNGWLAFSCMDNDMRKRLASFPPDWLGMSNQELESLLHQAVEVQRKEVRR